MGAVLALTVAATLATGCGGSGDGERATPIGTVTLPAPTAPAAEQPSCPFAAALVAVDPTTGAPLWTYCAGAMSGVEVLAATESTVLAAEYGDRLGGVHLFGLEAATGALRWSTHLAAFNESYERDAFYADGNKAGGGVVVANVLDGDRTMVVGIDLETGAERWRTDAESTFVTGHTDDLAITMAPGALFETPSDAPQPDLLTLAFDRQSGAVRWRRTEGIRDVAAPWGPRLGDGLFVFTQVDPRAEDSTPDDWRWDTVAVDAATGTQRWRRERGPLSVLAVSDRTGLGLSPAAGDNRPEPVPVLVGFDSATGDERWTLPLPDGNPIVWAGPGATVAAVLVVAGTAEAGTGPAATGGAVTTSTAMADGAAITAGVLAVVDRANGRVRYSVPGAEAAAVSGQLVLVGRGGEVLALDATDGAVRWRLPFAQPYGIEVQDAAGRLFLSSSSGITDPPPPSDVGPSALNVRLDSGVELGTFELPDGSLSVRFIETPDTGGLRYVCVGVVGADTAAGCLPEREEPAVGPPGYALPGSSTPVPFLLRHFTLAAIGLPAGHPRPVSVRAAGGGAVWPAVEATERDVLYVLDPAGSDSGALSELIEVVGPDGTVIVRSGPVSSLPNLPAPEDWAGQLTACYRANGADYQAATTGASALPTSTSVPLPGEIALAAWQACQQFYTPALPPPSR
ncbi:MAG: PQQ-binding-like beta-propeller repeat protein [Acidimicrobiales bacterium]